MSCETAGKGGGRTEESCAHRGEVFAVAPERRDPERGVGQLANTELWESVAETATEAGARGLGDGLVRRVRFRGVEARNSDLRARKTPQEGSGDHDRGGGGERMWLVRSFLRPWLFLGLHTHGTAQTGPHLDICTKERARARRDSAA